MAKKEEITDIIAPEAFEDKNFKKGIVLKLEKATLRITKVNRKEKRVWAEHISLYGLDTAMSHYGHNVDVRADGAAYCTDCECEVDNEATEAGEIKAIKRESEK
jgi:hypothetical protein